RTPIHQKVHSPVSAYFFSQFTDFLDEDRLVLSFYLLHLLFGKPTFMAGGNTSGERVLLRCAFCAAYQMDARIGAGRTDVMLQHNRFAIMCFNNGSIHVSPIIFTNER